MLQPEEKKPSIEESKKETETRLRIVETIERKLADCVDALILVGSMAHGRNYCVRQSSDIDLILLVEPKNIDKVVNCDLFEQEAHAKDFAKAYCDGFAQACTLKYFTAGVKTECHIWDKETQYKMSRLEQECAIRFSTAPKSSSDVHLDFKGKKRHIERERIPFGKYFLIKYSAFTIQDDCFVPYEPLSNLVMNPDIRFAKEKNIYENIDIMWQKLAQRLAKENPGIVDLSKTSIILSQTGHWNLPSEIRKKLDEKTRYALDKLSVQYTYSEIEQKQF